MMHPSEIHTLQYQDRSFIPSIFHHQKNRCTSCLNLPYNLKTLKKSRYEKSSSTYQLTGIQQTIHRSKSHILRVSTDPLQKPCNLSRNYPSFFSKFCPVLCDYPFSFFCKIHFLLCSPSIFKLSFVFIFTLSLISNTQRHAI